MSKENSFRFSPAILKYLLVIVAMWVIFILYVAKLKQVEPDTKGAGVVTGEVQAPIEAPTLSTEPDVRPIVTVDGTINESKMSRPIETEIRSAFQSAIEAAQLGDEQGAGRILLGLINQYPELPEPYANLASLQAKNGQLGEARATLLKGLQSNAAYAVLFSSLQKVQGAMAANAYRTALVEKNESINKVDLSTFNTIDNLLFSELGSNDDNQTSHIGGANSEVVPNESRAVESASRMDQ